MDRLYFIVNPLAGIGRSRTCFEEVKKALDGMGLDYGFDFTEYHLHAARLAEAAAERGEKYVVAVGGDGTINEVASGLANRDVVMGMMPFGTGNDLAKTLGIPTDPKGALEVLLGNRPRRMDAGMVNDRFFINVAGFGFDVDVLIKTEKYKKRFRGMIPYFLGIVSAIAQLRPLHLTLRDGDREWSRDSMIISVGNGACFGGGMRATPLASPFDGLLDVCVVSEVSLPVFLCLIGKFIKGKHVGLKQVEYFRTAELYVDCPESTLINYDGELGSGVPARFRVLPGAINMLLK